MATSCVVEDGGAHLAQLSTLHVQALKLLRRAGSYGMIQQNLFDRMPPRSIQKSMQMMKELEGLGHVSKSNTTRNTTRWCILWTITRTGAGYVDALASQPHVMPA